ncbi:DHBP synthase RibB-like alpha/beta domain-containing protein [Kockovaella imperatae]|uniref:Threonylcarbamoyl-AMP synthase n=1 Tax=Kockovaella imperatae TaxID=4999 RepID=A0A1Y1U6R0_9TREE|nr:DHBP synthase RibB-like alpha/beta domain-containing protein [Kockovaella imperatae]ORX33723.1 DHBP synthase RibB-like alpha/beta domain-containing protein [Kockovaella imperatae]
MSWARKTLSPSLCRFVSSKLSYRSSHTMSSSTPILDCSSYSSIKVHPSPVPLHPYQSPSFDIPAEISRHLETVSSHLHSSRTVAFPTETVYGLGASSLDPRAVRRVYEIKNRPSDNPLIIHVSSLDMLNHLLPPGYEISKLYRALIEAFWPGPLTLLFPSSNPPPLPAPQTNAIRMPSHPLAQALIYHANLPISAPSANSSGRPSPTCAGHVFNDLNGREGLGCILDGGVCGVGVESTVVNGLGWREDGTGYVNVLRPGGLGVEEVERIVREVDGDVDGDDGRTQILLHGRPWRSKPGQSSSAGMRLLPDSSDDPPSTPGLKYRHYSPRVPVFLLLPSNTFAQPESLSSSATTPQDILRHISSRIGAHDGARLGILHYDDSPLFHALRSGSQGIDLISLSLGPNSTTAAQRLFSGLLKLERGGNTKSVLGVQPSDSRGVDAILVEGCSDAGLGLAVMERVGKAVGGGGAATDLDQKSDGDKGRFWVDVGETVA